ncbi:RNA polymerase sigma factor [Actinopolyspora sp. H202]|uniref:RNA polymerase sigma factor n=1 Tax=Actinopolyspora sp. H202 TaxID=1500456 RepID=UPI003EE56B54
MSEPAVADITHEPERPLSEARGRRSTAFRAGLVEECRAGKAGAWSRLITEYQPLVWTVARSFGLNHADSEDLCQQTWQRLHEHIHRLQEPHRVSAWIVTTSRREAMKHVSKHAWQVPVDSVQIMERCTASVHERPAEEICIERILDPRLRAAVQTLNQHQRNLLGMLMSEPPASYEAISRTLGMPRGSIGPTRDRILRKIKQHMV